MRLSIEQLVTTPSTLNYMSESAYDSTKWNLGKGIVYNAGATPEDKYVSPIFEAVRPMEESASFAVAYAYPYNFNASTTYIFGVEASTTASATRRVHMWTVNRKTANISWNGFITLTLGSATAHTVRDFKIDVKNEATGTVAVSGTAVTGTSTLFSTNRVAIGARIGFGSTDPALITTWYRISAIGTDTGLTLASAAGTIGAGSPYVIQEWRPVYVATNATTTNGGVHIAKGVTPEDFTGAGTTISLAANADGAKAVYWLKDAAVVTNLVAAGCACDFAGATATNLDAYVLDLVAGGTYKVFKYNLRAALTVASGITTNAFVLATGNQAFTGTGSQNSNCAIATTAHGSGSGVKSLYFVSTSRIMRAAVSNITSGNATWRNDEIIEVTPGGASTYAVTGALSTLEYMSNADIFVIGSTHANGNFSYVTQYVSSGNQFQKMFGRDYKYLEQSLKDNGAPTIFSNQSTVCSFVEAGGNSLYVVKQGTAITTNQIYIMAFGADWDYASQTTGRLISPSIPTSNALKYYRVFVNALNYEGSTSIGKSSEAYRVYARTSNITTDDSTGWTLLTGSNSLTAFAGAANIQFAIEFKTIGETCKPARVLGINLEYEDNTTDSHYALSIAKSSLVTKIFAFWFKTAFGGTVPALRISLYDASTSGLLLTDTTTASANGTWEKTTDGTTWTAYNTTDRVNATTWIRYTPTSLADNIKVEAYITQA